ncbi:hypothetical protein VE03_09671 [Pseudogymnoascus sp. 23342-1-I1]|nr:hypothetical protein VE03_09671 [Pseudogymnoascus sp. 23342-1-I1]
MARGDSTHGTVALNPRMDVDLKNDKAPVTAVTEPVDTMESKGIYRTGQETGEGNQKFVPGLSVEVLQKIASISPTGKSALEQIVDQMLSVPPSSLGFPGENTCSNYYPGNERITREEIAAVSRALEKHSIEPENTRVRKIVEGGNIIFEVLQASVETGPITNENGAHELGDGIRIVRGDHAEELTKICSALTEAKKYTANDKQSTFLSGYIESFRTGRLDAFRESQKPWVTDISPRVENMIGFVEPYRDPHGIRAEWEGVVCISDPDETIRLKHFVDRSTTFIGLLPWAVAGENDGKGPFEKTLFEAPDFTSIHGSWDIKISYNDIRETCGFKSVVIANRMDANHNPANPCHYIRSSEKKLFKEYTHIVRFVTTAIHELIGHGTGKLMSETAPGKYNFDKQNPPINPLTKKPIGSYYLPGQTWTSLFEDIATTVEECRATLVSEYLIDNKELLSIFGYTDTSSITADDLIYNAYLQIGVEGLQALEHYNVKDQAWGEAHKRAHFAILKHLLQDGEGVLRVEHDSVASNLTVRVDRSKILSHGKPALGRFLCRLHIWRCVADVRSCRIFYEPLTAVDGEFEEWRRVVCSKAEPRWKFVQANTFLEGDQVKVKVYQESNEGIIQSWAERGI